MTESRDSYIKRKMAEGNWSLRLAAASAKLQQLSQAVKQDPKFQPLLDEALHDYSLLATLVQGHINDWNAEYDAMYGVDANGMPVGDEAIREQAAVARRVDMAIAAATGMGAVFSLLLIKRTAEEGVKAIAAVAGALYKGGAPGEFT